MGVRGLTSYISENSSIYLKPYELSDCYVVIDGSSVAHSLFSTLKGHSAFGGDYDEYFAVVRSFMLALKKCNVKPIILFDGGCDQLKLKTRLNRRRTTVQKLNSFCQGFSTQNFYPMFMKEVFVNAARYIGCIYVQCNTEADGEIATVARELNCPVLSYDSDYFIYNVIYIPFNTVKLGPLKYSYSNKYYMQCSIINPDEFLKAIGLDKPLLPILAALMGNDHVENKVFLKFFNHVKYSKGKNKSQAKKRLLGLIGWLKSENSKSAVNLISSHLRKGDAKKASKLFDKTLELYSSSTLSGGVSNELAEKLGKIYQSDNDVNINWPSEISKLYAQGFIPSFSVNMILHKFFLTPLQVENLNDDSSHFKSLNLIRKIYTMLDHYSETKKPLKLYLILKKQYRSLNLDADPSDYVNLDEVVKQPQEKRLKLLCELIGVPMDVFNFVPQNSWAIFIMSFLYWTKEYNNSVSLAHAHAFVIMAIANQIVQPQVGYYRNNKDFMKHHGDKMNKLKPTKLILKKSSNFEQMLSNVELYECLVVQKELIPLRRTEPEYSAREYCISTIHLFGCFQSCLYFIIIINALLNHPLPHLRIEEFYSGTLLFNLYTCIKSTTSVEKFGSSLFSQTPNLNEIYKYLCVKLSEIADFSNVFYKNVRKKRTKKKKSFSLKVQYSESIYCPVDNEDEFMDENNKYSVLLNLKDLSIN